MFELFGFVVLAMMFVPFAIAIGLVIAVLCGVGHIVGFVWKLVFGGLALAFGLLFIFGLIAAGVMSTLFSMIF
jgi:hypothetical protein